MCAYIVRQHHTTVSLSSGDVTTDEDADCSNRDGVYGDVNSVPRVSRAESIDSTYNELTGNEDSR